LGVKPAGVRRCIYC